MTTQAQVNANRHNAQRSTGPRTRAGKAIASGNALRHGLLAKDVILADEDRQLFKERRDAMRADLDPRGELEEILVERIVVCAWRLRRLERIEASVFRLHVCDRLMARATALASIATLGTVEDQLIPKPTVDKRGYAAALDQLNEAGFARDRETLALAFGEAASQNDTLAKLSRYEVALDRVFYRALHELQRLQAARQRRGVRGPVVVEVDLPTPAA